MRNATTRDQKLENVRQLRVTVRMLPVMDSRGIVRYTILEQWKLLCWSATMTRLGGSWRRLR